MTKKRPSKKKRPAAKKARVSKKKARTSSQKKKKVRTSSKKKARTSSKKKKKARAPSKKKATAAKRRAGTKKRTAKRTGRRSPSRPARAYRIGTAAWSRDGRVLATAAGKRIYVWDVSRAAPKKIGSFLTQVDASRIAVDADGSRVAAAVAGFSEVRIRAASTGALLHEIHARGAVTCFGFAPDGRFVLGEVERIGEQGLHARSYVTLVDLLTGAELFRTAVIDLPIREIAFSADGLLLFLGFGGGIVVVFDLEARRELFRFPSLDEREIGARIAAAFAFSRDGQRAAIGYDNTVEVWPIDGGDRLARIDLGTKAWSVALTDRGDAVIAGAPASGVWSLQGKKVASLDVAHPVVASPDGKRVLVGERINLKKGPALAPAA